MRKRNYFLLGAIPILAFVFLFANLLSYDNPVEDLAITEDGSYKGLVTITTTGDFEGRITEPHKGIIEVVEKEKHNLLTTAGQNAIENILGQGESHGAYNVIALCNTSAGCDEPVIGDTALDNEYQNDITAEDGLNRSTGTYKSLADGYYQLTYTFTADGNDMLTNKTALFNDTTVGGTMLAANTFTLVTLQSADQLTVNWTINITDGS